MEQLFIPSTLKIGYQENDETFTGKLAYIIYYDAKNKLRKEKSWTGWIEHDLGDHKNEPTEGFVINMNVGGVSHSRWDWGGRTEKIRIYDPRGYEIEITTENLLFILQECTSTKGKGLEGKFVYAWWGTQLVLLPIDTEEYRKSSNFTSLQSKKITKTDMFPGHTYRFKDQRDKLYLGRLDVHNFQTPFEVDVENPKYSWSSTTTEYLYSTSNKYHVFVDFKDYTIEVDEDEELDVELDLPYTYDFESGFTKIAECVSDVVADNYAELLVAYLDSKYGSKIVDFEVLSKQEPYLEFKEPKRHSMYNTVTVRHNDLFFMFEIRLNYDYEYNETTKDYDYITKDEYDILNIRVAFYKIVDGEFRYLDNNYDVENIVPNYLRKLKSKYTFVELQECMKDADVIGDINVIFERGTKLKINNKY